jgi:hypothetical protein
MGEYNGWANYETWNVNLWLMNDESAYRRMLSRLSRFEKPISEGDARHIAEHSLGAVKTPDDVRLDDPSIDWGEIVKSILECVE